MNLYLPTRSVILPRRLRQNWRQAGFISPALLGVIAGSRRRSVAASLAFVQSKRVRSFGATTAVITFDSSNTSGNLIAVGVSWDSTTVTLNSLADSVGNTYTLVLNPTTSLTGRFAMAYAKNIGSGSNTVTATFSGSVAHVITGHEISGANTSTPLDKSAAAAQTNPGTGTDAVTSGAVTTTANGEYIFGAVGESNNASPFTPGTGFTTATLSNAGGAEYKIQTSSGSIAATFTQGAGFGVTITGIMTFKA